MKPLIRCLLLAAVFHGVSARAATFTVTTTNVTGAGSLQQAMLDANSTAGPGLITFNIAGVGPHIIAPSVAQPLPSLTNTVTIDGYTQPGATPNTLTNGNNAVLKIQLDGTSAGQVNGLRIASSGNVIRGLSITRFRNTADGIAIISGSNTAIEGNFVGIASDPSILGFGNGRYGISIAAVASANVIGGTNPAAANVISGNLQNGVRIQGANNFVLGNCIGLAPAGTARANSSSGVLIDTGATGNTVGGETTGARNVISGNNQGGVEIVSANFNVVQGNFIGVDFTGTTRRPNTRNGIFFQGGLANLIGGTNPLSANVISGNNENGIRFQGNSVSNRVLGNFIGTDMTGTLDLNNWSNGVFFVTNTITARPSQNTIGNTGPGGQNIIAFNLLAGVFVSAGTNNSVRANRIFDNTGLGIDLGAVGVTINDLADADGGANQQQNFPVLTNAVVTRTNVTLRGSLNSAPSATFQVDFYANTACGSSAHGEGGLWLGSVEAITDVNGHATFDKAFAGLFTATTFTATATDANGNTSEFSSCLNAVDFIPTQIFTVTNVNDTGPGSLRQALLNVNTELSIDTIHFAIPGGGVKTLSPRSALPVPLDPVILDGYTQPGTIPNTLTNGNNAVLKLRLDGSLAGGRGVDGLHFSNTRGNVVRGLVIVRFSGDGIEFAGGGGNVVRDVWLGLDANAAAGLANRSTDRASAALQSGGCEGKNGGIGLLFNNCNDSFASSIQSSCNGDDAVGFSGALTTGNTIENSCAGGDPTWTLGRPNEGGGFVFRAEARGNTARDCTSMFNLEAAFACDQSDQNFFIRCHADECPGDAWSIAGNDNVLDACTAYDVVGDACEILSGVRNNVYFLRLRNIDGMFINLARGANGDALPLTDVWLGTTGSGFLVRGMGTIPGTVSGSHTIRGMRLDDMTPVGEEWYADDFDFPVNKGSSPLNFNQVFSSDFGILPGTRVLTYAATPNGSTAMTGPSTVVTDNNPDITVDLTVTSGTPQIGSEIRIAVTVANNGVGVAQNPSASFSSPFPVTAINFPGATVKDLGGGNYTITFPSLAAGAAMQGNVTVVPNAAGALNITATAAVPGQTDANRTNDSDSVGGSVGSGSGSTAAVTQGDRPAGNTLDPISTLTGELYEYLKPDLILGGPMPLGFSRYYASFLKRLGRVGTLGDNWRHNHEWSLTNRTTAVDVVTDLGRLITFTNIAGSYQLVIRQDIPFQLQTNGGDFIMADPRSQRTYTFNSAGQLTQVADGHGNTHTLAYTGNKLSSVSDGLGRTLTFAYSGAGFLTNISDGIRSVALTQTGNNLTSARNPLGLVTTYNYNLAHLTNGLMTSSVMPEGNVPYAQTFDASGRVATQTEAGTNTHTLTYAVNLTTVTDPLGRTRKHIHTPTGEWLAFTDENSLSLGMGYNTNGQRTAVTDRLGNLTRLGFHAPSGYVSGITNADGTFTTFTYTNRTAGSVTFHDLSRTTYPDGRFESFTYDASGNFLTRTDRAGNVSTFTYNARGQVLTAQNPLGGVTTFTYHANGTLASRADSDTGTTTFAYDAFSRLTKVVHPDGTMLQSVYDANDRVTTITDERNNTYTFAYDDNGNVLSVTDPLSQNAQFAYDTRDRLLQATDRLGKTSNRGYDQLDQITSRTNRNGNVTRFTYDTRRRMTSVTDPGNQVWGFGYDNEALLASASNPLNQTNRIRRDALGYEVGYTNALGQTTSLVRDTLRRVTATVDALLRTNQFGYDSRGLLTNSAKPVVGSAAYERNPLGLLSRITDLNGSQWRFGHTPMGRAAFMADPLNRTNRFTYDSRGRRVRSTFADGHTVSNAFDQTGNTTRRQYSDGTDLQYTYDALNRLVAANELGLAYDAEGRVTNTASSGVNFGAAYDAGGRLTDVTYNAGAFSVTYTYDSRDRLVGVSDSLTGTTLNFAYDNAGRLTGVTRPNGVNGTYTYDAAGRLTRIQEGSLMDLQYALNTAGQVTNLNNTLPLDPANGLSQSLSNWTHDAAHQISNAGYSYDARGRMNTAPGQTLQYDAASRLKQINSVTLGYNGFSDIVTRTEGGVKTRYYYNHALGLNPIVAEKNENTGQILLYYVWSPGGRLLYLIDAANGNAVRHFHFDRVGSTLALTDAAGAVTDSYAYTPFGELLGRSGTSVQPFLYVGRFGVRSEPGAKLYHMRARYYDPVSGRFLTRDPIWPVLSEPGSLDPYQYVAQNPLSYIDPEGMEGEPTDRFPHDHEPYWKTRKSARLSSLNADGTKPGDGSFGWYLFGDAWFGSPLKDAEEISLDDCIYDGYGRSVNLPRMLAADLSKLSADVREIIEPIQKRALANPSNYSWPEVRDAMMKLSERNGLPLPDWDAIDKAAQDEGVTTKYEKPESILDEITEVIVIQ